jgi:hypothetical protein
MRLSTSILHIIVYWQCNSLSGFGATNEDKTNRDLKYLWEKAVKNRNADSSSIPEVATVESSKHGSSNLRNFVVRREGVDFFF